MTHIPKNQEIDAMGTLMYMSPESIANKAGLASDIWSCGIALYMIATRKLPY
jgi:serine/threonine protein kinase